MNFEGYEKQYLLYSEFATTMVRILELAIAHTGGIRSPQSVQARAKHPNRLRKRLEEAELLKSETIETDRKDLAGVRLIFYTNTEVDQFIQSGLIYANFKVEAGATKIHHPTKETGGNRYQGIHFTVRLKDDRAQLPEYAKFAGLRCEIQIQTVLNHAWSETSHDIVYKNFLGDGYGSEARERIKRRFDAIMDKYLLPAGYEFQRIQYDYQRLEVGKELFDRDAIASLQNAQNNNERYEVLETLRDYTLPHYDDVQGIYGDLIGPLVEAAHHARSTLTVPIDSTFGQLQGHKPEYVVRTIVDIINRHAYADVVRSFEALCDIYRGEDNEQPRNHIINAVKQLAEYNIHAWNSVGPGIQTILADCISRLSADDGNALREIVFVVWREILSPTISGTTSKGDTITLHHGAVPVSDELRGLRTKVIDALFALFDPTIPLDDQRNILGILNVATTTDHQAPTDPMLAVSMTDAARIINFLASRAEKLSYEILEHLEERFLWDYRTAKGIVAAGSERFACIPQAEALISAIEAFRDQINGDENFVKYKVLVGFESVFPQHWVNQDDDYLQIDAYRRKECDQFVENISIDNIGGWLPLIEQCAATQSNDLATFPLFGDFLVKLATAKPDLAEIMVYKASERLLHFLPGLLDGLYKSGATAIYERVRESQLGDDTQLVALARHFRNCHPPAPNVILSILHRALEIGDNVAVIESLIYNMTAPADAFPSHDEFFVPAITYLTEKRDPRWVRGVWYLDSVAPFFASLSLVDTNLILENLLTLSRIDSEAERILGRIATYHLQTVWDFFGKRLAAEKPQEAGDGRYEAVPFALHSLRKQLSIDAAMAVAAGRQWYALKPALFRFGGGRLLHSAFPDCTEQFANHLVGLVNEGDDIDAKFVLSIMQNYHGEPAAHPVLQAIVAKYPTDQKKMTEVIIAFDNTGGVWGEDGYANALRAKKELMAAWLKDPRPEVKAFAEAHIRQLDLQIISEQRSADQRKEMRSRESDEEDGVAG